MQHLPTAWGLGIARWHACGLEDLCLVSPLTRADRRHDTTDLTHLHWRSHEVETLRPVHLEPNVDFLERLRDASRYQPTCPTTRHREGTICPERIRIQKHNQKVQKRNAEVREHNRKVDIENRVGAVVAVVAVVAIAALGAWWFLLR